MEKDINKIKVVPFVPLALYTELLKDTYASLSWSIRMGYPRITVYTENTRDKSNEFSYDKLIIAPMNSVIVNVLIAKIRSVIDNDTTHEVGIKCFNIKYEDNKKTVEVVLQATVLVGRDSDGVVYIAVKAENKSLVRFMLSPVSKWHALQDSSGVITDKRVLSNIFAKAYVDRLEVLMDKFLADEVVPKYIDRKQVSISDDIGIANIFD